MRLAAREHVFANIANILVKKRSFSINGFGFSNYYPHRPFIQSFTSDQPPSPWPIIYNVYCVGDTHTWRVHC